MRFHALEISLDAVVPVNITENISSPRLNSSLLF